MAKTSGLSQTAVSRIWRAFALQPHRTETFKLSKDPLFIEKVRDIVGLYLHPPDRALVLVRRREDPRSKRSIAARPCCRCGPGQPERRTHDYMRHGTTTLFAALDVEDRHGHRRVSRAPSRARIPPFLDTIDAAVPRHLDIHLILDNYATHKTALIRRWLANVRASTCTSRRPAPPGSISSSAGSPHSPRNNFAAASIAARASSTMPSALSRRHQRHAQAFTWTKTADEILASVARFCQRTSNSGH